MQGNQQFIVEVFIGCKIQDFFLLGVTRFWAPSQTNLSCVLNKERRWFTIRWRRNRQKKERENHSVDLNKHFYWISSHKARHINVIWHENNYRPVTMQRYLRKIPDLIWTQDLFLYKRAWKHRAMNKCSQTELEQSGNKINMKTQN